MTEAIFIEVRAKEEAAKAAKRRVSVSGMLRILGVSRSGYRAFLKRRPPRRELRKNRLKKLYHASYQNYGAPKITQILHQEGEAISERTVGKYMKEMGIRAQWVRHRTRTTRDSDYSTELHNILNEDLHPHRPNEAWCTDIITSALKSRNSGVIEGLRAYSSRPTARSWGVAPHPTRGQTPLDRTIFLSLETKVITGGYKEWEQKTNVKSAGKSLS